MHSTSHAPKIHTTNGTSSQRAWCGNRMAAPDTGFEGEGEADCSLPSVVDDVLPDAVDDTVLAPEPVALAACSTHKSFVALDMAEYH